MEIRNKLKSDFKMADSKSFFFSDSVCTAEEQHCNMLDYQHVSWANITAVYVYDAMQWTNSKVDVLPNMNVRRMSLLLCFQEAAGVCSVFF